MITLLIVMTGIMAGIYFAFSVIVMKSLSELPSLQAAQAMSKINEVIINTLFLPMFLVSTLGYVGLSLWSLAYWQQERSILIIMAALIYFVGMFLVTAFGNVPLNNKLKECGANESRLISVWADYRQRWTQLNHIRTISCTTACALLTITPV